MSEMLEPVVVHVRGEIEDALSKLRRVRQELKSLRSKTIEVKVKTDTSKASAAIRAVSKDAKKATGDSDALGRSFRNLWRDIDTGAEKHRGILGKIFGGTAGGLGHVSRDLKQVWSAIGGVLDVLPSFIKGGEEGAAAFAQLGTALVPLLADLPALAVAIGTVVLAAGAIGAVLHTLIGAAGALSAGAIGVGALVAVAMPTISRLREGMSALSSATDAYRQASENLNTALANSKQDMKQYQSVLKGVDPNLRGAVKLLRDQNVQWRHLSPSMRKSVVALSDNKGALKAMSPAMKDTLAALMKQKTAWDDLTPAQRRAAKSIDGLKSAWRKVVTAMQPAVLALVTDITKLIKNALPFVPPLARAAAKGIDRLLGRANNFVKSEQFRRWVKKLTAEVPHVIAAVGNFIAKLGKLAGPLLTNRNNVRDLKTVLDATMGIIRGTIRVVNGLYRAFNAVAGPIKTAGRWIKDLSSVVGTLTGNVGGLSSALGGLAGALSSISGIGGIGKILSHIPGFASGTPGAPPGWRVVGERGPELEYSRSGGEVILPNHHPLTQATVRGFANGAGDIGGDIEVRLYIDGKELRNVQKRATYKYNKRNAPRVTGALVPA